MHVVSELISTVTAFTAGLCIILALGQLVIRRKILITYLAVALLINTGIVLYFASLVSATAKATTPGWFYLHAPASSAIGPLLYLYAQALADSEYRLNKTALIILFLPMVLFIWAPALFILDGWPQISQMMSYFTTRVLKTHDILTSVAYTYSFFFYLVIIRKVFFVFKPENSEFFIRFNIFSIFLIAMGTSFTGFMSILGRSLFLIQLSGFGVALLVIYIFLVNQRYPAFAEGFKAVLEDTKRSKLASIDLDLVEARLEKAMRKEKLYRDGDLTLLSLAQHLDLGRHQLSEYLNQKVAKNFKTFVNEWRLNEAKDLLHNDHEIPIIRIALQVGFNSKSTFNQAFLKFTGSTPSDFREQGQNLRHF